MSQIKCLLDLHHCIVGVICFMEIVTMTWPNLLVGQLGKQGWSGERDLPRIPTTKQGENWGQSLDVLTPNPVLPPVQQGADVEGSCPLSLSSASLILCIKRQLCGQDRAEHWGYTKEDQAAAPAL